MEVRNLKIDEIKPYENNPRDNSKSVDKVAESISQYGFQQPIVVDKDMVIIVGHTRLKAAKKLGLKEVPVIVASSLNKEQVKAYRIVDNKVSDYSIWDNKKLLKELEELENKALYTGFSTSDYFEDVLDETDNEPIENNDKGVTYSLSFSTQNKATFDKVQEYINEVAMIE